MKKWIKFLIWLVIIAGIGGLIYLNFQNGEEKVSYVTAKVTKNGLEQVIEVNGTVESNSVIDLKFQKAGKILNLPFEIGDAVRVNDVLGELDDDLLQAEAGILQAAVGIAKANLNQEYAGPKSSEIEVSNVRIDEAEVNLANAEVRLQDTIDLNKEELETAELEVEDARIDLRKAEQNLANVEASSSDTETRTDVDLENVYRNSDIAVSSAIGEIRGALLVADSVLGVDAKSVNDNIEKFIYDPRIFIRSVEFSYAALKSDLEILIASYEAVKLSWTVDEAKSVLESAEDTLNNANNLLEEVLDILKDAESYFQSDLNVTDLVPYQSDILNAQDGLRSDLNNIKDYISNIEDALLDVGSTGISTGSSRDDAEAAVEAAKNRLKIAEANWDELKLRNKIEENNDQSQVDLERVRLNRAIADHADLLAGPRAADIAVYQARINQEAARHNKALIEIEDTKVASPVNGVLTAINVDVGENVSAADNAFTIITPELQIRANVAETDIMNVNAGDEVRITLDALPIATSFTGVIERVDPAETIIQGVVYYQTIIRFDSYLPVIKSGMTANLEIFTEDRSDVLIAPPQAINFEDEVSYVFVLENGEKVRREVEIGLETDDGIEIMSGLEIGEEIILYEE